MDIAEIRKKAKAQTRPDELVLEPIGQQAPGLEQEPLADQGAVEVVKQEAGGAIEENPVTTPTATEGLDRLFAATGEFVLATDESYADSLDSQAGSQTQTSCQYLAFHLGDEEYALDIKRISEIIKVREFTDIPRAPGFILGIISLRGVVVPVFDLRQRLNLGISELMSTSRIVVCQSDDVSVGLLVDSINQVVDLIDEEVEPPPGVLSGLDREMVSGIGRYQSRMIILLNLPSVLYVESLH